MFKNTSTFFQPEKVLSCEQSENIPSLSKLVSKKERKMGHDEVQERKGSKANQGQELKDRIMGKRLAIIK